LRVRAKLLVLFILMAGLDAGGKTIERHQPTLDRVQQFAGRFGARLHLRSRRSANNFDIFRGSSQHLVADTDLYASYPSEHRDRFKYSPSFAFLFTPLAYMPWGLALLLWQLLNALALFYALTRLLKDRVADVAIAIVFLEVWRSMQNAQSNSLVAATIVLAFVALEERKVVQGASWIGFGAAIKIFPLIAGVFALPVRSRWRAVAVVSGAVTTVLLLPLLVTPPAMLVAQYRSWLSLERVDAMAQMQSVMGLLQLLPGPPDLPNLAVQLLGLGVLLLPLALHPERWNMRQFRLQVLASTLVYVVLFNHQAERASYVIAFTGIAIWYVSSPRGLREHVLLTLAFLAIPVASLFIPGRWIRSPSVTVVRLVVPCLIIWIEIQVEMLRARYRPVVPVQSPAGSTEPLMPFPDSVSG
jgi:hypothetical protein